MFCVAVFSKSQFSVEQLNNVFMLLLKCLQFGLHILLDLSVSRKRKRLLQNINGMQKRNLRVFPNKIGLQMQHDILLLALNVLQKRTCSCNRDNTHHSGVSFNHSSILVDQSHIGNICIAKSRYSHGTQHNLCFIKHIISLNAHESWCLALPLSQVGKVTVLPCIQCQLLCNTSTRNEV